MHHSIELILVSILFWIYMQSIIKMFWINFNHLYFFGNLRTHKFLPKFSLDNKFWLFKSEVNSCTNYHYHSIEKAWPSTVFWMKMQSTNRKFRLVSGNKFLRNLRTTKSNFSILLNLFLDNEFWFRGSEVNFCIKLWFILNGIAFHRILNTDAINQQNVQSVFGKSSLISSKPNN